MSPQHASREAGRLASRPGAPDSGGAPGLHPLGLDPRRDSYLYVPDSRPPGRPAPLVVMLHGAGGHAQHGVGVLQTLADAHGFLLLAPASRGGTWDVIMGGYGPDVSRLDQALAWTFGRHAVDPTRLAIAGFSDGASYALSLGIGNGDLFTHLLAFSPGFAAPAARLGKPAVFVSHGVQDPVLPIQSCSRRIVPRLEHAGYEVYYREFDGGHIVPARISTEALEWFLADGRVERGTPSAAE